MDKKKKIEDNMLLYYIDTIARKLESVSLAFGLNFVYSRLGRKDERDSLDSDYNVLKLVLGDMLEVTLKRLDYMKKRIESGDYNIPHYTKEYNKTLYIKVIKRVYFFIKAYDSGCFVRYDLGDGVPIDNVPVSNVVHKKLVEGMQRFSTIFDGEATDILRTLLDYLEKANLPILELPWEYQTLVRTIIGTVRAGSNEEYLMMKLDEILIICGLCEDNFLDDIFDDQEEECSTPMEKKEEECSTPINTSSIIDDAWNDLIKIMEEDENVKENVKDTIDINKII